MLPQNNDEYQSEFVDHQIREVNATRMMRQRAVWLRVVPWDGTVSLWWKSVPNPRPSFTIFSTHLPSLLRLCNLCLLFKVTYWMVNWSPAVNLWIHLTYLSLWLKSNSNPWPARTLLAFQRIPPPSIMSLQFASLAESSICSQMNGQLVPILNS